MSNVLGMVVPSKSDSANGASWIAADGTKAKIIVDATAAALATTTAPAFYGGASVFDLTATSTDSADKDFKLFIGNIKTTQASGITDAMATTTSTVTRAGGSFIADGWRIGMQAMFFAPANSAENAGVDGILCTVTAVAAGQLTFNGTPIAALGSLAGGTRVARVKQLTTVKIPLGSGNSNTAASVSILTLNSGSIVLTERKLGATDMLIAAPNAAVSALPVVVTIDAQVAYY